MLAVETCASALQSWLLGSFCWVTAFLGQLDFHSSVGIQTLTGISKNGFESVFLLLQVPSALAGISGLGCKDSPQCQALK